MIIESRAPVRIDFAGAWTDVPYFSHPFGGATVNAAIDRYVTGRTVVGAPGEEKSGSKNDNAEGENSEGVSVTYQTDVPAGSGLGTSSALNVVWLSLAAARSPQNSLERSRIAEQAYQVETVLGIIGGKQDHYAAAHGGFHLYEFEEKEVRAIPIGIDASRIAELEGLLTLCYSGQARHSSNLHQNVWGGFRAGRREVVDSLFQLRDSAYIAREILESGSFDRFGALLSSQHKCAQQLDASLSNELVEGIFDSVKNNISGGKCCGAGGGGCILFCSDSPQKQKLVAQTLRDSGVRVIPFRFAMEGLTVTMSG